MAELMTNRWLARDPNGLTITAGWDDIQRTAQRVHEMCGQQSMLHYHAHGDACNERCDIFPPKQVAMSERPAEAKAPAATLPPVCGHGVTLERDCGECIQEARIGAAATQEREGRP